jgi:hypothetical protein
MKHITIVLAINLRVYVRILHHMVISQIRKV